MIKHTDELKDRVESKMHSLMARMKELSADTREEAREAGASIKKKLADVQEHIKDGWDNVTETTSAKLNAWLDD